MIHLGWLRRRRIRFGDAADAASAYLWLHKLGREANMYLSYLRPRSAAQLAYSRYHTGLIQFVQYLMEKYV